MRGRELSEGNVVDQENGVDQLAAVVIQGESGELYLSSRPDGRDAGAQACLGGVG